jgi:molybdopterin biosynthesis enzyme
MKLRYRILGSEKLRITEVQASRKMDVSIFSRGYEIRAPGVQNNRD